MVTSTTIKIHNLHKLGDIAHLLLIYLSTLLISLLQVVLQILTLKWRLEVKFDDDTFESAEDDEINKAIKPGLWIDFSTDEVAYWIGCLPTDSQHHNSPFDKSCRYFAEGKPARCCSQKLFYGIKANGEQYKREWLLYSPSTGSAYCFLCQRVTTKCSAHLADKDGLSDWRNNIIIDNHEQSTIRTDYMSTYLTRSHGLGLLQNPEKQFNEEHSY